MFLCFQSQLPGVTSRWFNLYLSCLHLYETESPSLVGPVKALEIIYSGIKRNQGKLLSSSSMTQPVCTQGSHPISVAVDLGQIIPAPPAAWRLMILQLITVNRITVDLPQYYTPKHKPTRRADGWGWAALAPLGTFICSEHFSNAATYASYWFMKNSPI